MLSGGAATLSHCLSPHGCGEQRGAVWVQRGAANCSPAGVEGDVLLIAALQEWKRMVRAEIGPNEDAAVQFWSFWLRLAYGCCQFFLKTPPFCYRLNIFFPRRACLVELRLMPAGQRTVSQTSMFFLLRTESTAEHIPLLQSLLQHRIAFFPGGLFC